MNASPKAAVLAIEIQPSERDRANHPQEVGAVLDMAKSLLATPTVGTSWAATAADDLSGTLLLEDAGLALPKIHQLRTELRADPARPAIRLAVGLGRGDDASRRAREALSSIQSKRRRLTRGFVGRKEDDLVLEALCSTLDSLVSGWTDAQWQAIYRRDRGRTLQQIGQELGIAYQNVSKRLIAAQYGLYRDVLEAASLVFSKS